MKAALHDGMYCMPLAFAFPDDDFARRVEDEVMIGESLLIAPVYEQNARGRYVYLPEEMLQVRVKCSEGNRIETGVLPAGHHYIPVELEEVVFFVRKGHILPIAKGGKSLRNVADVDFAYLRLLAYAPMVPLTSTIPMTARQKITTSRSILCILRWMQKETQSAMVLRSK